MAIIGALAVGLAAALLMAPAAYDGRGAAYANKGQYKRAIQDYDQATRLNPSCQGAYYNRGRAWYLLKQDDRAIRDLDQATRLDESDWGSGSV